MGCGTGDRWSPSLEAKAESMDEEEAPVSNRIEIGHSMIGRLPGKLITGVPEMSERRCPSSRLAQSRDQPKSGEMPP